MECSVYSTPVAGLNKQEMSRLMASGTYGRFLRPRHLLELTTRPCQAVVLLARADIGQFSDKSLLCEGWALARIPSDRYLADARSDLSSS